MNTPENVRFEQSVANLTRGLPLFIEQPGHKGSALIVGGGPSLKETLPSLKIHKNRGGIIFALNGTHDWLIDRGIIPDYHVLLDAREENKVFVTDPHKDCIYLVSVQCHPKVFDSLKNYRVTAWVSCISPEKDYELGKHFPNLPIATIGGGSTVGLKAMNLVYLWGFRRIYLYGFDSCYRGENNHAYSQPMNEGESKLTVHVDGKRFICSPWMIRQANEFDHQYRQLEQKGCKVIVKGEGLIPYIAQTLRSENV